MTQTVWSHFAQEIPVPAQNCLLDHKHVIFKLLFVRRLNEWDTICYSVSFTRLRKCNFDLWTQQHKFPPPVIMPPDCSSRLEGKSGKFQYFYITFLLFNIKVVFIWIVSVMLWDRMTTWACQRTFTVTVAPKDHSHCIYGTDSKTFDTNESFTHQSKWKGPGFKLTECPFNTHTLSRTDLLT